MINSLVLETVAEFSMEQIMPHIGFKKPPIQLECLNGKTYTVRVNSVKFECFRRNHICVFCRKEGCVWLLQLEPNGKSIHLNMFWREGEEKMMLTLDHICPRSKNGKTRISNSQTLCQKCNQDKGDRYPYP